MKKVIPRDAVLIPDQAKNVFEGVIYDVYQWPQKMHDGSEAAFEMLRRPDTVEVIGVADGKLLVIDDDQPHSGSKTSFPGGRVDAEDSSILTAAQREMLEETGYEFEQWRLVSVRQLHTKIEWFIHFFLAFNGQQTTEPHLDAGEKITMSLKPFNEVKQMSQDGVGHLGESRHLFDGLLSLEDLLALPAFNGQKVDR